MTLLTDIAAIVGVNGVLTGDDVSQRAGDWLGLTRCTASAVVRPRSTEELAAVMKLCHAVRQPVVPAGGLTGLVHGTDCTAGEIQISFERMRSIIAVDPIGRTMVVEAGVPLEAVHEEAARHGLVYGVDLGARGSCTIGGNISTNAGGNTVLRYGMTRENVLGIEAVLADGTVVSSLNALLKNNAAYDLKQLFIGSEGTLGLVTRAVLRLRPRPTSSAVAMVALGGFAEVAEFFARSGHSLGGLINAFEVLWRDHYRLVAVESGRHVAPLPDDYPFYVLIEAQGTSQEQDAAQFEAFLADSMERGLIQDAIIAASEGQAAALWAIREDIEGIFKAMTPSVTFDVSLPIARMDDYVTRVTDALRSEWGDDVRISVFGHLGDCNLHVVVAPRPWNEDARGKVEAIVYGPLEELRGSVSAEHGIGLEKRCWLSMSRSPAEIALMRQVKQALDPLELLNPGKVLL